MSGLASRSWVQGLTLSASVVLVGIVAHAADDPPVSPTAEEREAVRTLAAAGAAVSINGDFQVVSVSLSNADGVNDDLLAHLKHLPHLESATIRGENLTDAALKHFEGLKQLRYLSLLNATLPDEGVQKLQAALPQCRIIQARSFATFGGRGGARGGPADAEAARAAFEAARAAAQPGAGANAPGAAADLNEARLNDARAAIAQRVMERGGFGGQPAFGGAPVPSGRGFGTRPLPSPLLQELLNVDVQVELQITSEQWQLVQTMCTDAGTAQQELVDALRAAAQAPKPDAEPEPVERVRAATEELRAAADERLKALLTAEQFQRLQQLAWQTAGPRALFDAPFAADLQLGDDQRTRLESVRTEQRAFLQQLAQPRGRTRGRPTSASDELFGDDFWKERLLAVLTEEQRAAYDRKLGLSRESADEQQLGQHAFALLDANGDQQIDETEWQSQDAERLLSTLSLRGMAPLPLSREEFVRAYVAAHRGTARSTRQIVY